MLTIPAGAPDPEDELAVDKLPTADDVADARRDSDATISFEDVAAAQPMKADTMTDLEKYILIVVQFFL